MKSLLLACLITLSLYSCCKAICEDQGLFISVQNIQAVDTDTVYLIKYKPSTGFADKIDTVKHFANVPAGSTLPSTFREMLEPNADWKVVIPGVNKEYFISNIETGQEHCECGGGKYTMVTKYRLNNAQKEGNNVILD